MLRRLWVSFVRLITGEPRAERERRRISDLLHMLRHHHVTEYEAGGVRLRLDSWADAPPAPGPLPPGKVPSETELLFGLTDEQARREGLI
jgi:hypothetical protein